MKLAPKPKPREPLESRESTSTRPTGKASSYTANRPKKQIILDNVSYTGVDQHGQAVATEHQKQEQKTDSTKNSVAIISSEPLGPDEKKELFNLGVFMAQMKWLDLYTNCEAFKGGVEVGEGVTHELGAVDDYSGVVLYKAKGTFANQPKMVEMNDPAQLYEFVGATAKELYRRGILR
jgi:hypothetical protein